MNIGLRIKQRRKALKMSADDLGKRLGKDRSTIYRYEKGDIENLPLDILEPIATALQTTPQFLMGWQEVQKKNDILSDIILNKMKTPVEIGKTVRALRGELSLRAFAKKCNMSHTTIDYIEKGVDFRTGKPAHTSAAVLNQIATSCGVSLEYLIGASPSPSPSPSPSLSDLESKLIELFRAVPDEDKEDVYKKIEFALSFIK